MQPQTRIPLFMPSHKTKPSQEHVLKLRLLKSKRPRPKPMVVIETRPVLPTTTRRPIFTAPSVTLMVTISSHVECHSAYSQALKPNTMRIVRQITHKTDQSLPLRLAGLKPLHWDSRTVVMTIVTTTSPPSSLRSRSPRTLLPRTNPEIQTLTLVVHSQ